jgi:probable rRNA maturation factor
MTTTKPNIELDCLLIDADAIQTEIPDLKNLIQTWAKLALVHGITDVDYWVNFQFMSKDEVQALNNQFRDKNKPTNVLTFPNNTPFNEEDPFIGDIAICTDILREEAEQENKTLQDHLAHLVIHSILHCQGFDHKTDEEANEMEGLEIKLLEQLNIANPY